MMSFSDDDRDPHISTPLIVCIVLAAVLVAGAFLIPMILGERPKNKQEETTPAAVTEAVPVTTAIPTEAEATAAPETEEVTAVQEPDRL